MLATISRLATASDARTTDIRSARVALTTFHWGSAYREECIRKKKNASAGLPCFWPNRGTKRRAVPAACHCLATSPPEQRCNIKLPSNAKPSRNISTGRHVYECQRTRQTSRITRRLARTAARANFNIAGCTANKYKPRQPSQANQQFGSRLSCPGSPLAQVAQQSLHTHTYTKNMSKQTGQTMLLPAFRCRHFSTEGDSVSFMAYDPSGRFSTARREEWPRHTETTPVRVDKARGPSCRMAVDAVKWRIQPKSCEVSYWLAALPT